MFVVTLFASALAFLPGATRDKCRPCKYACKGANGLGCGDPSNKDDPSCLSELCSVTCGSAECLEKMCSKKFRDCEGCTTKSKDKCIWHAEDESCHYAFTEDGMLKMVQDFDFTLTCPSKEERTLAKLARLANLVEELEAETIREARELQKAAYMMDAKCWHRLPSGCEKHLWTPKGQSAEEGFQDGYADSQEECFGNRLEGLNKFCKKGDAEAEWTSGIPTFSNPVTIKYDEYDNEYKQFYAAENDSVCAPSGLLETFGNDWAKKTLYKEGKLPMDECKDLCSENDECTYITYYSPLQGCDLFKSCTTTVANNKSSATAYMFKREKVPVFEEEDY